ncbi:MAG: sulfatase-like hydrolase/transferase, partial [Verrucomicrobiota bacterium]
VGKYHVHDAYHHSDSVKDIQLDKQAEYNDKNNRLYSRLEKKQRKIIQERGFDWVKNVYWGNMPKAFKGHNPEWTIQAALEFVEANQDQPFYLHYCTTLLHGPNGEWYKSLTEKAHITGEGTIDEPIGLVDRQSVLDRIKEAGLTEDEVGYLWMDDTLGLLLDKLDELGIADNTIIAFVSDHGSNKKGSLFKSRGTEIPCIVRWPDTIAAGSVTEELVQNTDFVPTWLELAGAIPADYPIDGISLLPLFEDSSQSIRDYVYAEQGPVRSIKTKEWGYQAIRYTADQIEELEKTKGRSAKQLRGLSGGISRAADHHPGAFDADQLYQYNTDPEEQTNLAEDQAHREQLKQMQSHLKEALAQFPNRPFGEFIAGGNALPKENSVPVLKQISQFEK